MRASGFEGGRRGSHIKALIPIGIQGLLDDARRVGLFSIYGDDRKWVRETKDLALGEAIRGDD